MKYRVLLLTIVLLFAVAVIAIAQGAPQTENAKHPILGRKMVKELGLTKDQVKQIHAIVEKYRQDVTAVAKSQATKADKAKQIKEIRTKAAAAINAVLTPEQQTKAQKMRLIDVLLAGRKGRAEFAFMAMVWKLDLTAEQKTTIKGIVQPAEAAAKAIRQDSSLKPADKAQKLAALRKETNEKVLAVLTPEQKAKLQEMMKKQEPAK